MSEFCSECFKRINKTDNELVLSSEPTLCEGCGELKPFVTEVIIAKPKMTIAECQVETQKHIEQVRKYIRFMIDKLDMRGVKHDASKLESPEVEVFADYTSKLNEVTFGSDEYKQRLSEMKPALDHHYASNRHHPEHFMNGINDMTLIDILEMFCDWKASTLRYNDGNLLKSIEANAERFSIDSQLKQILLNTARMIDEHED